MFTPPMFRFDGCFQRAAFGLSLEVFERIEQRGTSHSADGGYGAIMSSLFFPLSHGPVLNNRASENLI
jgi:hypothetical protein